MSRRSAVLAAPLLVLLLSACVPAPDPVVEPSEGTSSTATPTPTQTATSVPSATPAGPDTVPVPVGCADILSPEAIYDYNPNFSLVDGYLPSGGLAAEAVDNQGLACELVNQSSGQTIVFGVVQFTASGYASKTSAVAASASPAGAFDGYFDAADGEGVAQAFSDPYWITVTSAAFVEAGDVAPLVETVVAALP